MPIFSHGVTKNKLLLMYAMRQTPYSLTEQQLYRIIFDNDFMPYLSFCEAIAELKDDGFLNLCPQPAGDVYVLTDDGIATLDMFLESLPVSERERINAYELKNRETLKNSAQYLTDMRLTAEGGYAVRLQAADKDRMLLEIELPVATRELAQKMRAGWEASCPGIYDMILDMLLDKKAAAEPKQAGQPQNS